MEFGSGSIAITSLLVALGAKKEENPFLRARSAEYLAKIRTAKDNFK